MHDNNSYPIEHNFSIPSREEASSLDFTSTRKERKNREEEEKIWREAKDEPINMIRLIISSSLGEPYP